MNTATLPTRDEILNESAGPRLNAWVAKHVMRVARVPADDPAFGLLWVWPHGTPRVDPPDYSGGIAAAWEALTRIEQKGDRWYWQLGATPLGYRCKIWQGSLGKWTLPDDNFEADGETVPLAICRAALLTTLPT